MIYTLKLDPQGDNYISSDWHVFHDKEFIWGKRGFASRNDHADWIRDSVNDLPPSSTVVHLGDMFLTCTMEEVHQFLSSIREDIRIFTCAGNHNFGVNNLFKEAVQDFHIDAGEIYPLPLRDYPNVIVVPPQFVLKKGRFKAHCSHFAALLWDNSKHGRPMFCGHSHGDVSALNPDNDDLGRILDVGVENAQRINNTPLISLDEAKQIVLQKDIARFGHH